MEDLIKDIDSDEFQKIMTRMSPDIVATIACKYIFDNKIDSDDENLFLSADLDPKDKIHANLIDSCGIEADSYKLHVYGRKAGFNGRFDSDGLCQLTVLRGFQVIRISRSETQTLNQGDSSQMFDLKTFTPSIPKNLTLVRTGNGRATIKAPTFRTIILWSFTKSS